MNKDDTVFSYENTFGLHVNKVRFTKNPYLLLNGGCGGNFHFLTPEQKIKIVHHEEMGYEIINGYSVTGKDFANHVGKMSDAPHFERDIALLHRRGHGCIAIYPSGAMETHSSKSWKPVLKHFKM